MEKNNQGFSYNGFYTIQDQNGYLLDRSCIYYDSIDKQWICDRYNSLIGTLLFYQTLDAAEKVLSYLNKVIALAGLDLELKIIHTDDKCFKHNVKSFCLTKPVPRGLRTTVNKAFKDLKKDKEVNYYIVNDKGQYVGIFGASDDNQ